MKKLKVGFGEGGVQGFLARHVEKCVLVIVILLMAYFIYSGSNTTSLENDAVTQEKMKKDAADAERLIADSKWTTVADKRRPLKDFLVAVKTNVPVESRFYATRPWDPLQVPRLQPRTDPKVYPPENLVVVPIRAPLVLAGPEQSQEDAELPEDPLEKFPVTLGGNTGYGGAYGGSPDGPGAGAGSTYPGSSPDGPSGKRPSRRDKAKAKTGGATSYPGSEAYGQPQAKRGRGKKTDEATPYGDGATPYAGMGGAKKPRTISPEATIGVKATPGSELRPAYAMIVNASIDFTKQWQAYQDAFSSAPGGQDPSRDVPDYIAVWAQRADVTDNPDIDAADIPEGAGGWISVPAAQLNELERLYGQEVPEISDPEAIERRFTGSGAFMGITRMVPPFLLTDLTPALTHPDIPRATAVVDEYIEEEMTTETIQTGDGEIPLDTGEMGSEGGSAGRRSGYGGAPGAGAGYGRAPGAGSGYGRGRSSGSTPYGRGAGSTPYGRGGGAGAGAGATYRGGRSFGSGEGGNVDFETYRPVAKKLVRYVDFTAKPGRKYRYRLKVVLQDPNHPAMAADAPEMTILDEKARQRIRELEAKDAAKKSRTYWIDSEWSEPTKVVSLPSNEQFYAGSTSRPGTSKINNVDVVTTEPQAKVLTVQWDDKLGVFAPTEQAVYRASVLNTKADVEVIHPILGDLRKISDYQVRTDGIVLDMAGGQNLPGADKEPQKAPGETLLLDAEGNLVVTDEANDVVGYRKYIFPEPKEEPVDPSAAAGTGPDMGEAMLPPGYPGAKPGRKSRSRD